MHASSSCTITNALPRGVETAAGLGDSDEGSLESARESGFTPDEPPLFPPPGFFSSLKRLKISAAFIQNEEKSEPCCSSATSQMTGIVHRSVAHIIFRQGSGFRFESHLCLAISSQVSLSPLHRQSSGWNPPPLHVPLRARLSASLLQGATTKRLPRVLQISQSPRAPSSLQQGTLPHFPGISLFSNLLLKAFLLFQGDSPPRRPRRRSRGIDLWTEGGVSVAAWHGR